MKYKLVVSKAKNISFTIKRKYKGQYSSIALLNKTSNCQVATIDYFNHIVSYIPRKKDYPLIYYKELYEILEKCVDIRNLLLLDVKDITYSKYLKELFQKTTYSIVKVNSPYISTNGSNMRLLLIDVRNFLFFLDDLIVKENKKNEKK